MGPRTTPEDEEAKAARERERLLSEQDRSVAAQQTADDLTTDAMNVYGRRGHSLFSSIL